MNDYEIRKLILELEKSFNEKIQALQSQIDSLMDKKTDTSLISYYVEKYSEKSNAIKEKRLQNIKNEIFELTTISNDLKIKLDETKQESIKHDASKIQIFDYEKRVETILLEIENENFEHERKKLRLCKNIDTSNEVYENVISAFSNVVEAFIDGEIFLNELVLKMNQVLRYFKGEGAINTKNILDSIDEITKLEKEHQKLLNDLNTEKEHLNEKIQEIKNNDLEERLIELEAIFEDNNNELARKTNILDSLETLLTNLSNKHLQEINDAIVHEEVIGTEKSKIASIVEEIIKNALKELEYSDTKANIKNRLLVELSKKEQRIREIEEYLIERKQLESEYANLQNVLEQVNDNIQKLENYIEKAYQIIRSNQTYRNYFDQYASYTTKVKELNKIVESIKANNNKLYDERRQIVRDPYKKARLNEIDETIENNNEIITIHLQEINYILSSLKQQGTSNESLFKVISEKEKAENSLPQIIKNKDVLIEELTTRYEKLKEYDAYLDEYNSLLDDIERIKNQIENYIN